jgi:hypothetical protein
MKIIAFFVCLCERERERARESESERESEREIVTCILNTLITVDYFWMILYCLLADSTLVPL